jgi:hypothetical protein
MNTLRNFRILAFLLPMFAVVQPAGSSVSISQNTLAISQNSKGEVVASGSGKLYADCFMHGFNAPTFSVDGTRVTVIDSAAPGTIPLSCVGDSSPPIIQPYQETVNLGVLAPGNYAVVWPTLQLEGEYVVEGANPPTFAISPGISGNWFDPNESGHGFSIEVLDGNQMLAQWYVFAPGGGQAWIVATGPINGSTAVLQGFQALGSGGRFPPNYNPAAVASQPWGTITFTFADCNSGQASWSPTAAGYSAGSIPISRLTIPAGMSCL